MLRLSAGQVESLWDEGLPGEVRALPEDLAALDELLCDPAILRPIESHWQQQDGATASSAASCGRPTISMQTYVRLMVVKHRTGWGYETLMREVSDSLHLCPGARARSAQAGGEGRQRRWECAGSLAGDRAPSAGPDPHPRAADRGAQAAGARSDRAGGQARRALDPRSQATGRRGGAARSRPRREGEAAANTPHPTEGPPRDADLDRMVDPHLQP